ncbi:MAG: redoxin domain-containing protein [Bacteroidota bacterium]
MRKTVAALVFFLVSFAGSSQTPLTTAVDFIVTDTHGNNHKLFDYLNAGKYVLLDFFFVSCPTCQATAPDANASYEYFGCNEGGVVFLGIDAGDNTNQVQTFDNFFGVNYPCASGTEGGGDSVNLLYQITNYPCYVLIAPNHNIVIQEINPFSLTDCNNAISGYGVTPMTCLTGTGDSSANHTELNMLVFPNPASAQTTVLFMADAGQEYTLDIIDFTGRCIIRSDQSGSNTGSLAHSFDLSDIARGTYFIRLFENGLIRRTEKISVVR